MTEPKYDVLIVGASIAGCSAAILFARKGAKVALIERNRELSAYKKVCSHYIQASARPAIERLGLASRIEAAGAIRNGSEVWTRWGWIRSSTERSSYGYSIRREKLDPILREAAADTIGIDLMLGHSLQELSVEQDRPAGIVAHTATAERRAIRAMLVVGADGRQSRVAELAGMPSKIKPNRRFCYFTHYRDLSLATGTLAQVWYLDPDVISAFPNDDGITLISAMPTREKLDAWRSDIEGNLIRAFQGLPGAPSLKEARRISPFRGMIEMPNIMRPAVKRGIALIGDAALTADPLWGVGCGWAFQSAEWLVDSVADQLDNPRGLDRALEKYRRRHRWELGGHALHIANYATGRRFYPIERLMFSAAVKDPTLAAHVIALGDRSIGVSALLTPSTIARAARVNLLDKLIGQMPRSIPI